MKILITGGTGLVGSAIIQKLIARGDEIINLSTSKSSISNGVQHIMWNPKKGEIKESIPQVDAVINLAGYSVANKWTTENKAKIIDSRMQSTELLMRIIRELPQKPKVIVTTSASGYYAPSYLVQDENAPAGTGFLSELCVDWENATLKAEELGIRRVILRVGVVLAKGEGALGKMLPFFKLGVGSATGSGKQYMSWIHLQDLADMYIHAIDNEQVSGSYNACSPNPVTNYEYSKTLAKTIHRPFFFPNVPKFALDLLFGEMSSMLLNSQRLSAQKIIQTGFHFKFTEIKSALKDLL